MAFVSPAETSASQIRSSYHSTTPRANLGEDNVRYDFIMFLETCQNLEIDFLPITWQPALDALGVGGQSEVRQSMISLAMSFAFNRVKPKNREEENDENEEKIYRALISQVSILRLPEIRDHPNIIHLIGVCWDVRTPAEEDNHPTDAIEGSRLRVWPVLVVEKTKHGDLNCFMKSIGRNLGFAGRLKLCIDIATGIRDLHKNRVVHRDIKPHNILVSEDKPGSYMAKIADLGYAVQLLGDDDYEYMPVSMPWQAPERHHRGHLFSEMVKMDIYSFGLVCLWLLFNEKLYENDLIFDALPDEHPHPLESKKQNGLKEIAERLAYETTQSSASDIGDVELFFRSCLTSELEKRTSDMNALIEILSAKWPKLKKAITSSESSSEVLINSPPEPFQISRSIVTFYQSDYRIHHYLVSCLQKRLEDFSSAKSYVQSQQVLFQLAVCFRLGFGLVQDYEKSITAAKRSGRQEQDLNLEIERVNNAESDIHNEIFRNLSTNGLDTRSNTIWNTKSYSLAHAQVELQKDLTALSSEVNDTSTLLVEVRSQLAFILGLQGRWMDAEELFGQIMKMNKRVLGEEHPGTLINMSNLASTFSNQGRWKEAEELDVQVMEISLKVLGEKHPNTLTSMGDLASTFSDQGRWKEAEK